MPFARRATWLAITLFFLLAIVGIAARPLLARDETRYLSVAWEMWQRSDFLVPHLNNQPYSHKAPLLFWLMHAGWKLLGVSEWWARLIGPLCAIACFPLLNAIARRLNPGSFPSTPSLAALILASSVGWMIFAPLTMFDALLTLGVLSTLLATIRATQGTWVWWLVAGAGIGFSLLAKGPVALVHTLPVMLTAWWWGSHSALDASSTSTKRKRVPSELPPQAPASTRGSPENSSSPKPLPILLGAATALILGTALALAWALPAAKAGGEKYASEILLTQTAGRAFQSFRHARPIWFYLPILPAILIPWATYPPIWRALGLLKSNLKDNTVRFCLAWIGASLIILTATSGKQIHYLLPILPAFALLAARLLPLVPHERDERMDQSLPAYILLGAGVGLIAFPIAMNARPDWVAKLDLAPWTFEHHPIAAAALVVAGVLLLILNPRSLSARIPLVAATWVLVVAIAQWDIMRSVRPHIDLEPMAKLMAEAERAGRPIAHLGTYEDQYHFLGRLNKPLDEIWDTTAPEWAKAHPNGLIVGPYDNWPVECKGTPAGVCPAGRHTIIAWSSEQILNGDACLDKRGRNSTTKQADPADE